jgi:hypothetical protein
MKVTVIKEYIDKYTGEKHFPGEVLSVSAERMAELGKKDVIDKIPVPEDPVPEDPIPEDPEPEKVEEKEEAPKKTATKKRTTRKKG